MIPNEPVSNPSPLRDVEETIWQIIEARIPATRPLASRDPRLTFGGSGLGLDSVQILDVIVRIEDAFAVRIPEEHLLSGETSVSGLAAIVAAGRQPQPQS